MNILDHLYWLITQEIFWYIFGIYIIWGLITCLPLPNKWFIWRIKQSGGVFYIESKGFLKPWWHKVPDSDGNNIRFYSLDRAREFLDE